LSGPHQRVAVERRDPLILNGSVANPGAITVGNNPTWSTREPLGPRLEPSNER